jgi:hypothetical protein
VRRIRVGYILSVELGARAMKENIVAASGLDEVINYQHINCYCTLLPRNVFCNVLAAGSDVPVISSLGLQQLQSCGFL